MQNPADIVRLRDEDLMLLVARGIIAEPAGELFRRHNRGLFNFLAWQCQGDTGAAEDLAQKVWEKLLTRCGDYQPDAAFRTFLYQIARNAFLDARRGAYDAKREEIDETHAELPADEIAPELLMQLRQQRERVHAALMELPVVQREVVVLRFFAEMSLEEIAATVGEGFETVKSRLRYAFTRLRCTLEAT